MQPKEKAIEMLIDSDEFIISTSWSCFVACSMVVVYIYTTQYACAKQISATLVAII